MAVLGAGCILMVFGCVLVAGGAFACAMWTWLAHQYSTFIWGGFMVIISGCMTARLADKQNQLLTEMAVALSMNLVSLAVCVNMLCQAIVNFIAFIGYTFIHTSLTSPLQKLIPVTEDETQIESINLHAIMYETRSSKEAVAAVDISILLAVLTVTITTAVGVSRVRRAIQFRAGEDALINSWYYPSAGLSHEPLSKKFSNEVPIQAYTPYDVRAPYDTGTDDLRPPHSHDPRNSPTPEFGAPNDPPRRQYAHPKITHLRRPPQTYPVTTPDIVQHMYSRY